MNKTPTASSIARRVETPSVESLQELRIVTTREIERSATDQLDELVDLLANDRGEVQRPQVQAIELSIVITCLNQASTVADAILRIQFALERIGKRGEILVVDRGSLDDSVELAEQLGARVFRGDLPDQVGLMGTAVGREILASAQGQVVVLGELSERSISDWF